ncbi:MAG: glycosyltransferase family 2 protein [Candidatus Omnitrophica bacterium]|nr:glycosyltransferase family 2 protein [Candidatus Omnitrophota bacterium]MDD5430318.1 glycosyltransferase family 2 protein [Candidatus Omnitrophota bacterium]
MPVNLSIVIIAKNEASRIEECLKSVAGWASEIILVDDESSDSTRQIASRYTDRVLVRKMDIEGRHRNWAYSQAKNTWILSLDADERVTGELREEIETILAKDPGACAFTIPRKNFLGDYWLRRAGQYPSAQLKLFRRDKFRWEEVEVHPRAFLDGKCAHLTQPLLHYTYRNFGDFLKKLNSQTTLEAKKWLKVYQDNPKKANYKMNFVHAVWRFNDRFFRAYLRKQGFRDGFIGFMISFFSALYQIIAYAKYWEMKQKLTNQPIR